MVSLSRLSVAGALLWLCIVFFVSTLLVTIGQKSQLNSEPENSEGEETLKRLSRAIEDIETLKKQNAELKKLLQEHSNNRGSFIPNAQLNAANQDPQIIAPPLLPNPTGENFGQNSGGPSKNFEILRRRIENGLKEFWFFIGGELRKIRPSLPQKFQTEFDRIIENSLEQKQTIAADLKILQNGDGFLAFRQKAMKNLTEIVQKRFHYLQNPSDCSKAKKLVCHLNKGCGYGCQIHHVVYCMAIAYGTQRTLILNSQGWRYSHKGWESVFRPISEKCTETGGNSGEIWRGEREMQNVQVVQLPIVDSLHPRPPYLPLSFPEDLADELLRLHGSPPVWWVGQMLKFLLRPQPALEKELEAKRKLMGIHVGNSDPIIGNSDPIVGNSDPIVGIHVRRTDKLAAEAQFHPIDEYMKFVEDYFDYLEILAQRQNFGQENSKEKIAVKKKLKRRVYLATDDPGLWAEVRQKYPAYEFLGDQKIANSAQLSSRYSDSSLHGIIMDIHFLSLSDYLVCTFSSQVCRIAYELMQTMHVDASDRFHSLDDIYYFGGQDAHEQIATFAHRPPSNRGGATGAVGGANGAMGGAGEIELQIGDVIGIAGNHWDGFSKGKNRRTGQMGLYPSFKVRERWRIVKMPDYKEAINFSLPLGF